PRSGWVRWHRPEPVVRGRYSGSTLRRTQPQSAGGRVQVGFLRRIGGTTRDRRSLAWRLAAAEHRDGADYLIPGALDHDLGLGEDASARLFDARRVRVDRAVAARWTRRARRRHRGGPRLGRLRRPGRYGLREHRPQDLRRRHVDGDAIRRGARGRQQDEGEHHRARGAERAPRPRRAPPLEAQDVLESGTIRTVWPVAPT